MAMEAIHGQTALALTQPVGLLTQGHATEKLLNAGFLTEFKRALDTISTNQIQAQNESKAFQRSDPNTSLNEVMVDLQKSTVSLQFGIQVRNKMVSAYQEIMNITI